jgi:DNA-binding Lrp family transcriptional regulator
VRTYILIQVERGADPQVAREVAAIPGVRRVERVSGPYDLIAEADGGEVDGPGAVPRIQALTGVLRALGSLVLEGAGEGPEGEDEREAAGGA